MVSLQNSSQDDLNLNDLVISGKKTSAGIQSFILTSNLHFPFTTFYWYPINSLFKTRLDILWSYTWTFQHIMKSTAMFMKYNNRSLLQTSTALPNQKIQADPMRAHVSMYIFLQNSMITAAQYNQKAGKQLHYDLSSLNPEILFLPMLIEVQCLMVYHDSRNLC